MGLLVPKGGGGVGGGSGTVVGPGTSTDTALARFDGTDGALLQDSAVLVDDTGNVSGVGTLATGAITATSINKVTVTQPASSATLTISNGKTLAATDTSTLVGSPRSILLCSKIGANMNSTADQSMTVTGSTYILDRIIVTNASISLDTAVGGIYTAASKGGTAVVANTQVYSALTASSKWVNLTINTTPTTDVLTAGTLYVSLTTPQGAAATADVYVLGTRLS